MWKDIKPISEQTLREFEEHFHFNINTDLKQFLQEHNAGCCIGPSFPVVLADGTTVKHIQLDRFFDFSEKNDPKGAWAVNKRVRKQIGNKRIVIGRDRKNNLVCLERDYSHQYIVVWFHVTMTFQRCILDKAGFMKAIS